ITRHPNEDWMKQIAKNLTFCDVGFLNGYRFLLHDGDTKFTLAFRHILNNAGIKTLMLPYRSPNLNAYAERFVRTVKEECLRKMIISGEPMLRGTLNEYITHYNHERNHQ